MNSFATLFSGGEGASIGATFAGLQHEWGIDHDAQIANVATTNGFDVLCHDVAMPLCRP